MSVPQPYEVLALKGNYEPPALAEIKTGQKLHQNLILMKSAPRRFGKNTRGDETPICKMGRYIWANGKYVTIMNIPPPPFILL